MEMLDRLLPVHVPGSTRAEAGTGGFPEVSGSNLEREVIEVPGGLAGEINLLLLAFQRHQQALVDEWLPIAKRLESEIDGLRYYELPVVDSFNAPRRFWLNEGMRAGIPDPVARERTITLFVENKVEFLRALDIESQETIYALLVSRDGEILWRAERAPSDDKVASLRAALS